MKFSRFILFVAGVMTACSPAGKHLALTLDEFELYGLDGKPVDMKQLEGKVVFINVWATWCRPCIQEMPTIAEAMQKLQGKDIVFLFASNEELDEITAFRDRKQFPFNYVQLKNLEGLSIEAIPATFIFNSAGNLVYGEEGFRDWSTSESLALITQQPIQ